MPQENWTDIHPDFAKVAWGSNTHEWVWGNWSLTYQDAKEWIAIGFKPQDYKEVKKWKEADISSQQAQEWIKIGFNDKYDDYEKIKQWKKLSFTPQQVQSLISQGWQLDDYWLLLIYTRSKNYQPADLQQPAIQEDYLNWRNNLTLQNLLDSKYPTSQEKEQVKEILIGCSYGNTVPSEQSKYLVGNHQLNLTEYPNLEKVIIIRNFLNSFFLTELNLSGCGELVELHCPNNQLTKLDLSNCFDLKKLDCSYNHLSNLNFLNNLNSEGLTELSISGNNITSDLSPLRKFINLERLDLSNNKFFGSLEPFAGLVKLRRLDVSDTDIDSGLEYLPESVGFFDCSTEKKKDAKCKTLVDLLKNTSGEDFSQKLQKIIRQKAKAKLKNTLIVNEQVHELKKEELTQSEKNLVESQQSQAISPSKKPTQIKPTLNHLLGRGGYGEVYYGKWNLQDVAVKKLFLSLSNISQKDLEDIMNEINLLKNLRNRYIIQYYDIYSDDQELLIIMDFAENGTLTKFINDNKNKEHDWGLNTKLIKQLALGLAYIHQKGIIHRDLKSLNVLLTDGYTAKISDFGLSRTKNISSSQSKNNIVGSLRWMAPELLKGQKYSEPSDVYALGMIIWEIVAKCTTPFKDIDNNLVGFRIISGEKETMPDDAPENVQKIIRGCWENNPNERLALVKILEIMDDELNSQVIHTSSLLEQSSKFPSSSEEISKDNKGTDNLSDEISKVADFDMSGLREALEEITEQQAQIIHNPPKASN